jgi:hypothetical protein
MDELTLLRDFRPDTPGPSPAETAAARARLLAAIDGPDSGPRRAGAPPRRAVLGRRAGRRWLPVAAAAAVTAVVITAAAIAASGARTAPTGPEPASVTAAIALRLAASAAARQPAGHGRFFVTESEYISPQNRQDRPALRIFWLGNGVEGRLIQGFQSPMPPGIPFGRRTLTWGQLRKLPTAPGMLLAVIATAARNMGEPLANAEFDTVAQLLEAPAPPALRAALYDVTARLPGIILARRVHDLIGRSATEVVMPSGFAGNKTATALFFDPSTGAILGQAELVSSRRQCPPGWEEAVLASGYVGSTHQLPPGATRAVRPVTAASSVPGCPKPSSLRPTPSPSARRSSPAPTPSPSPSRGRPTPSPSPSAR